jgi:hypothetical protein
LLEVVDRKEDMEMNEVSVRHKALIGATGGLCLVLLKLIDASFYVDDFFSKQAIVGYLTYFAYLIIGTIVAVFLTEHDVPKEKMRKSAFISGLLGPSILIAILTQPVVPTRSIKDIVRDIPKISWFSLSPAIAQTHDAPAKQPAAPGPVAPVQVLKKDAVEPSFKEAFLIAVGRSVPLKDHVYVVGVSDSETKAKAAAGAVNELLTLQGQGLQAQVLKPEGIDKYYVTLGGLKEPNEALQTKATSQAAAIEALKGKPDEASKRAATFLLEGKVVKGDLLFK